MTACDMIRLAGESELNEIIGTLIQQYSKIHPDWEMWVYVIQKSQDQSRQIDEMIAFLEGIKTLPVSPKL